MLGIIRDKVPTFDVRRLHHLRTLLFRMGRFSVSKEPTDDIRIPMTEEVMGKVNHILGDGAHGIPRDLVLEYICDLSEQTISGDKID